MASIIYMASIHKKHGLFQKLNKEVRQFMYTSLLLIITLHFTCGKEKISSTIKILKILLT